MYTLRVVLPTVVLLLQYNVSLHLLDYFPYCLHLFVPTLRTFGGCHVPQFSLSVLRIPSYLMLYSLTVTSLPDLWGLFTFRWVNPSILPPIYWAAIFFPLHGKPFEFGCQQLLCALTSCAVVTALVWVWVQTVAVCIHVSCHCDHTCLHHCDHARSGSHTIAAMSINDPFSCKLCNCSHYFDFFCLNEQLFSSENCLFSLNIQYISSYVFFLTYLKSPDHYVFWHISNHSIIIFYMITLAAGVSDVFYCFSAIAGLKLYT